MKKIITKIVSTLLAAVGCLSFTVTGFADVKEDRHNEGQQIVSDDIDFWNSLNIDHSFAYQVRMATNAADRQADAGNPIGGQVSKGYGDFLNMSNIGPFYGYTVGEIESDQLKSPENVRTAATESKSVRMYSREQLLKVKVGSKQSDTQTPAFRYYTYGLLLNMLGFDSVGTDANDVTREVYGTAAQISYAAASSVNMVFESCFNFLWATNPFLFFKNINSSAAGHDVLNDINSSAMSEIGGNTSSIDVLTAYFGNIFNIFTDFAWTVSIPLSLLFIIVSFFLTRRGRYMIGSNIKKFFVRVIFVAIGIPILGSAYTQVLDGLRHTQSTTDEFLAQAVSKTFIDFGAWVEKSRLSPPQDLLCAIAQEDRTLARASTIRNVRQICSEINVRQNKVFSFSADGGLITSQTGALLKDYIYNPSAGTLSISGDAVNDKSSYDNRQAVNDILKDYKAGTKYSATMFESGAIAWMQESSNQGATSYGDMLALSADKYSFSPAATRLIRMLHGKVDDGAIKYDPDNPGDAGTYGDVAMARFANIYDFANTGYNIWNNGGISVTQKDEGGGEGGHGGQRSWGMQFDPEHTGANGYACEQVTGLSTMSMYTYLTSEFTQEGILTYGDSPSVYTHKSHYAVNLVGSNGIMQFAFIANMLAILLGYFVLAVAFVFRTVFDILFKGFQIMGHALLAAAGFYKSIGTCICMVVNMISQLFVTVVFFSFMVDFMFMLTSIFDKLFFDVFDAATGIGSAALDGITYQPSSSYAAEVVVILSSLVSSFVIVFFVSFATKWRALIMNSINSMVENIVGTCLGVNLSGASDGAVGGMLKSAFNDAKNVAKTAAVVGGGVALVDSAQDMIHDLTSDKDDEQETAADAAVNPKIGSGFGSKDNKENENDQTQIKEGKDLLDGTSSLGAKSASDNDSAEYETDVKTGSNGASDNDGTEKADLTGSASSEIASGSKQDFNEYESDAKTGPVARLYKDLKNNAADTSQTDDATEKAVGGYSYGGTVEQQKAAQRTLDENTSVLNDDGVLTRDGSSIRFDAQRGLVMSTANGDGTMSDIGIGAAGLSLGSTDSSGTAVVKTVGSDGKLTIQRSSSAGESETFAVNASGMAAAQTVRTLDNGDVETIDVDAVTGVKRVTVNDAATGSRSVKTINTDGTYTVTRNINGKDVSYSGVENGSGRSLDLGEITLNETVDTATNVISQAFTSGNRTYDVTKSQTGSVVIHTVQNGASHEFINNLDGSANYVTTMDGYERRETFFRNGNEMTSKVVYRDSSGNDVNDSKMKSQLDSQYSAGWQNIEADVGAVYDKYQAEMTLAGMTDMSNNVEKRDKAMADALLAMEKEKSEQK